MRGSFVCRVKRIDTEELYRLINEDGRNDFRAGRTDGFLHFPKVALELLKLGFANGDFCRTEEAFLRGIERWEREEFIEKPQRPFFVGALRSVDGALLGGFALELLIKVS